MEKRRGENRREGERPADIPEYVVVN